MAHAEALIAELDEVLGRTSSAERLRMLRRVVDLFINDVDRYSDDHVDVFDDVIVRMIDKVERNGLVEVSGRLAAASKAPVNVVGRLSSDSSIVVSGPFLEKSTAITDQVLVEVAKSKGPDHLALIANRACVSEPVTDALLERANDQITRKLIANEGARFSEMGYVKLISEASHDKDLAQALSQRKDVPPELQPFLDQALAPPPQA
jgi:uncharacterized protein (DUF2336 family)